MGKRPHPHCITSFFFICRIFLLNSPPPNHLACPPNLVYSPPRSRHTQLGRRRGFWVARSMSQPPIPPPLIMWISQSPFQQTATFYDRYFRRELLFFFCFFSNTGYICKAVRRKKKKHRSYRVSTSTVHQLQ
ncbi:hypothetical protein FKM82_030417 [Ascaphus truei]